MHFYNELEEIVRFVRHQNFETHQAAQLRLTSESEQNAFIARELQVTQLGLENYDSFD